MSSVTVSAADTAAAQLPDIINDHDKPPVASWIAAALCVVALHALIAYVILNSEVFESPGEPAQPVVMVDLSPVAAAPPSQEDLDVPPAPEKMEEAPPDEETPPTPDVTQPQTEPQPLVEMPQDVVVPEAPQAPKPEVVLETQKPPPPPPKPTPDKKKVEKVVKKEHKPRADRTAAPKRTDAPASENASGNPFEGARSNANWQSQVSARLNSVKRCPGGGSGSGTATVGFSISGGGSAGGARLARSSGNPALDAEAVSMVHRAAPYPPTPSGGTISLTVPIHFGCGG